LRRTRLARQDRREKIICPDHSNELPCADPGLFDPDLSFRIVSFEKLYQPIRDPLSSILEERPRKLIRG